MQIKNKLIMILILALLLTGCQKKPEEESSSSSSPPPESSVESSEESSYVDPLPIESLKGFWARLDPQIDDYPLYLILSEDVMTLYIEGFELTPAWECEESSFGKAILTDQEDETIQCNLSFVFPEDDFPSITISGLKDYPDLVFYQGYTVYLNNYTWEDYFTYTYQLEELYDSQGNLLGINVSTFYQLEPVYQENLLVLHATYQVYYLDVPVLLTYDLESKTASFTLYQEETEEEEDDEYESVDESEPEYYNGVSLINSRNKVLTQDHWGQTIWFNDETLDDDSSESIFTVHLILRLPAELVHVQGYLVLTLPASDLADQGHQLLPFPAMPDRQ